MNTPKWKGRKFYPLEFRPQAPWDIFCESLWAFSVYERAQLNLEKGSVLGQNSKVVFLSQPVSLDLFQN